MNSIKKSKKTLFVSDLDGTLLDPDARLPNRAAERINKLTESGVMITYATARTVRSVAHILDGINFAAEGASPVALMNGVLVRDMKNGRYVRAAVIPPEKAEQVLALFEDGCRIEPFVYALNEAKPIMGDPLYTCYREIVNEPMASFMQERVQRYGKPFEKIKSLREIEGDIIYFAVIGGEADVNNAAEKVGAIDGIRYACYRDSYNGDVWYLEIFDGSASKKHAVEYLREISGADEVVCFGDNLNDLPMFEAADVSVAVERAAAQVKEKADLVTADVVGFIENYVRMNENN